MPKPVVLFAALDGEWVPGRVAGYLARQLSDEFDVVGMGPSGPPPLGRIDAAVFPDFAGLRLMSLLRPDTRIVVTVYDHFLWRWDRTSVDRLRESLSMCDALLTTNAAIASDMRAYADLPAEGATLEIYTDDKDPEYQKLEVRIKKMTQGGQVRPTEVQPLEPAKPAAPEKPASGAH